MVITRKLSISGLCPSMYTQAQNLETSVNMTSIHHLFEVFGRGVC